MRITLAVFSMSMLWMCGEAPLPAAEHGGVVLSVGSQPLELVTHADGQVMAYPLGESAARGPSTAIVVHVPGADGVVHTTPLVWDEPSAKFVGTLGVAPQVGPVTVDAVIAGAPVSVSTPVIVVLPAPAPVVVAGAPSTVELEAPHVHGHVDVVAPHAPGVVVEAPRAPGVVVEAPRAPGVVVVEPPHPPGVVLVEPPHPRVVVEAPRPPGIVVVEPPRPGVVVVGPRAPGVVVEPAHGHWDHGRHGGRGPEWHGGGHGHGHGHGR